MYEERLILVKGLVYSHLRLATTNKIKGLPYLSGPLILIAFFSLRQKKIVMLKAHNELLKVVAIEVVSHHAPTYIVHALKCSFVRCISIFIYALIYNAITRAAGH
jgi:hypothetical protein